LVVGDVTTDPRYRDSVHLPGIRAELALPLRIGEKVLGVLDLESATMDAFGPDDIQVLQTLADQIAVAIHNAQLFQAEAGARRMADTLRAIGQAVNSTLELDTVLTQILACLGEVLAYNSATIMLLESDELVLQAGQGFANPAEVLGLRLPLPSLTLNRAVMGTGRPVVVSDVSKDSRWVYTWIPGSVPIRSWMGVPLLTAGQAIGMLTVDSFQVGAYRETDLPLISAFADQAALALRNAELFRAASLARSEAEQANRLKSTFLDKMSHKLRTPLNAIINFAYLLDQGAEGSLVAGQAELVERIEGAGCHLLGLINDILDLAKIEAGRMELYRAEADLVEILGSAMTTAAGLVAGKPVRLDFEPGPIWSVRVYVDRRRIQQVALNLLSNAAKFTDQGSITMSIRADPLADLVAVAVADTGRGIAPADLARVFEEFAQVAEARNTGGHRAGPAHQQAFRGNAWRHTGGGQSVWPRFSFLLYAALGRSRPVARERRGRCGGGRDGTVLAFNDQSDSSA